MKQFILLFAICVSMYSCTSSSSSDKTKRDNLAIAKRYMNAVETNNVATMDSLLADNYVGYGPSFGDSVNKTDAIANWKYNTENLYESVKYTRYQNIAVTTTAEDEAAPGDWVSNWAFLAIKYKDGRGPINLMVNAVYKIENGKIVRSLTFYNEADALRQLGYAATLPDTGK